MTDRELMQMALDALMMCNSETMYASQRAAMNRLRDRLAQPELEFSIQAGKHRQPLKQVDPSSVYLTKPNNPTPSIEAALDKLVAENERLGLYKENT